MIRKIKIFYFFEEEDKKLFLEVLKFYGMTRREFAERFEISECYVSAILNGKRACPDFMHVMLRKEVLSDALQDAYLRVQRKKSV